MSGEGLSIERTPSLTQMVHPKGRNPGQHFSYSDEKSVAAATAEKLSWADQLEFFQVRCLCL